MKLTLDKNEVSFEFKKHKFLLLNCGEGVWRLVSELNGGFDLMGAAQTLSKDVGEKFDNTGRSVEVKANRISAEDGSFVAVSESAINFFDCGGRLVRSVADIYDTDDGIAAELALNRTECLYGTGERFNRVNQRGKKLQIFAIDRWCGKEGNSYIPIPFVMSSECGAVYFNRFEHSVMDLGRKKRNRLTVSQKYTCIDMYVFTSDSPSEILCQYSKLTGFAPMPPEWAFGTLVCRYHPEFSTKEGVLNMVNAMEQNRFPWEGIIMEGWGAYNSSRWDELKELSETVHSGGKKMMVYEQCGKFPGNYTELGLDDGAAVNSLEGTELKQTRSLNLLDNFHHKKMRCVDITNEESIKKWNEVWDNLVNYVGIDGAKIDFCEQFPDSENIIFSDGRNPHAAHHWYPVFYNILRLRHFNTRPDGGLNFSRGGGIGTQRYPFVWAGDQRREYNFLGAVIKAALSLGLSGVPFVSWDMAGYRPAILPADRVLEKNIFMRAVEFTAFSPNIQTHGNVTRPYDFDEHTKDVYRAYTTLHDALRPYIVQQAKISTETGLPVMRHLFLSDPKDRKACDTEDEYMFGDGLLVAPVTNGLCRRNIYLPEGEWVNIFTGKKYYGGRTAKNVKVPLEAVPVFRRLSVRNSVLDETLKNAQNIIKEIVKLSK